MHQRYARLAFCAGISAVLTGCGGGAGGTGPPIPSSGNPAELQPITVQGYKATFKEFSLPSGQGWPGQIVIGGDGAAWFTTLNAVDQITSTGTITPHIFSGLVRNPPGGVTYGPAITRDQNGDLWFDAYVAEEYYGSSPADGGFGGFVLAHLTTGGVFTGPFGNEDNLYENTYLAVGSDGRLWSPLCQWDEVVSCNLLATTSNGAQTNYGFAGPPTQYNSQMGNGIVTGPDGNLWCTAAAVTFNNYTPQAYIAEYNVDGTPLKFFPLADGSFNPANILDPVGPLDSAITVGPDKNLWFVETGSNKIGRMTLTGTLTEFSIPTANADARQITSASDGALWFTEHAANKVGRITTSGAITEYAMPTAKSGPNGITACEPYGKCSAVPHARLWITEEQAGKVARLDY